MAALRGVPGWVAWAGLAVLGGTCALRLLAPKDEVGARAPTVELDASVHGAPLPRPGGAVTELAVLVDPAQTALAGATDLAAVAATLDVAECGPACDAVRGFVKDASRFEVTRRDTADYVLPPEESWDVVAQRLSADERASLSRRTVTLVVRAKDLRGRTEDAPPKHLGLRAALAVTTALARSLDGVVYDETLRRIEPARDVAARAIREPLDQPVFAARHIVVQAYAEAGGETRLITLGLGRFGAPDLSMRGVPADSVDALGHVLNAAASVVASGARTLPLTLTPADLARVSGQPAQGAPIALEAIEPGRTAGDPDNVLVELVPPGGSSASGWTSALGTLTGGAPRLVHAEQGGALVGIAARARATLLTAKAQVGDGGALFVKGPFPIGGDAGSEWMWIEARTCNVSGCTGTLTNDPAYATRFRKGDDAGVRTEDVADWLLRLPDGGTVGGASIAELERR